jgi:CBS domain-containing protein
VRDLVTRPPTTCEPGVAIRTAARMMTENDVSALLVRDGARLFLVTDAALRARVIAGELSTENPVSRVVTPAVIVAPGRLAVDAIIDLLDAGQEHLVVADGGDVLGVLSAADLMGLETRSPFALRHALLHARDEEELVAAAARLRPLYLALVDTGLPPAEVGRVLSLQLDSIVTRLIELGLERLGPAPAAWAWLALGSSARREFTLGSDQENALAYADGDDPALDEYFGQLAAGVEAGLERCGFPLDPNDVVASNRLWRMSAPAWEQVFRDCLESPDRSHLIRANVVFDFRHVAGGLDVTPRLVAVLRGAREHPDFIRRLARTATDFKPPLGFRGALVVEKGAAGGRLDIKRGGGIPIANLARFFALSHGITISGTEDRLVAAEEVGALDHEAATALREAFEIVMRIRLEHHAAQLESGEEPDNLVDPAQLPPLARAQLREAFRAVAQIQKRLAVYVPLGL